MNWCQSNWIFLFSNLLRDVLLMMSFDGFLINSLRSWFWPESWVKIKAWSYRIKTSEILAIWGSVAPFKVLNSWLTTKCKISFEDALIKVKIFSRFWEGFWCLYWRFFNLFLYLLLWLYLFNLFFFLLRQANIIRLPIVSILIPLFPYYIFNLNSVCYFNFHISIIIFWQLLSWFSGRHSLLLVFGFFILLFLFQFLQCSWWIWLKY
jgi:hypothetical protein